MSKEDYNKLMQQAQQSARENLGQLEGRDAFFLYTLDNFVYRYLEDDKCAQGSVEKIASDQYLGKAKTYSMKLALEQVPEQQKPQLVDHIKESMGKDRATSQLSLAVDARDIDEQGGGQLHINATVNWDFPQHTQTNLQHQWSFQYESENWDYLRKHFALFLEEVCEVF